MHTPIGKETGSTDRFGVVRTISKTTNGSKQSGDFVTVTNSKVQSGKNRNAGPGNPPADPQADYEETSRQRYKTSTKQPGTNRVTPPLVTPLVDNGASIEKALTNIVDSIGEQNEQMSLRMSELERETPREEVNSNRQEVGRSEKRLKERTDEYLAINLSQTTREAELRETRLRDDMEKMRTQQEQTLGTLDTRIDAMTERCTQAIMDRLDGLLRNRSGARNGETNSREPSREPRVNFNEQPIRRRTHGSTRGRGSSSSYARGDNRPRGNHQRKFNWQQTNLKRTTDARHTCDWET